MRAAVSIGLAIFVYTTIDRKGLLAAIQSFHLSSVCWLLVLYTLGQFLSALKWRIFVHEAGFDTSLSTILRAYFLGMFVNVFGLGTVGGDVARSIALVPPKGRRAAAIATVVADRVHGLGVLLTIGTLAAAIVRPSVFGVFFSFLMLGGVGGVLALLLAWYFGPVLLLRLVPESHSWRDSLLRVANAFPRRFRPFCAATAISFVFHNVQLAMHFVIARELAPGLSWSYLYATVPYVNIVASLPFSLFNGFGVREQMYKFLLTPAGVPPEVAVAFGVVWLFTVTVVSGFGVFFVSSKISEEASLQPDDCLSRPIPAEPASPDSRLRQVVGS